MIRNKEIWRQKKCPECGCSQYDFNWGEAQLYRICACGIVTLLCDELQITIHKTKGMEKP